MSPSEEFIPTLTHATERDIDLLLVEELLASHQFIIWVAAKVGYTQPIEDWIVLHSKRRTRSRREIDIFVEITYGATGLPAVILIENKIDASEQPEQAESYREELDRISDDCSFGAMILVCPAAYAQQHLDFSDKFDTTLTYEEISRYFERAADLATGDLRRRMQFRCDLLEQAVGKNRRGYVPIPNPVIGDFNALYVELLSRVAPAIKPGKSMLKEANPDDSTSMIFDHNASLEELPKHLRPRRFAHELGRGLERRANYVAVTFAGWGTRLQELKPVLEADAAELAARFAAKSPTKIRPNPGLVMFIETEPVDNQGDFEAQKDALIAGVQQAEKLRRWLIGNQEKLEQWQRLIA